VTVVQNNKDRIEAALRSARTAAASALCNRVPKSLVKTGKSCEGLKALFDDFNSNDPKKSIPASQVQPLTASAFPAAAVAEVVQWLSRNFSNSSPFIIAQTQKTQPVKWIMPAACNSDSSADFCRLSVADWSNFTLKYQWDVTKTTPDPVQNLQAALSQGGSLESGATDATIPLTLELNAGIVFRVGSVNQTLNLLPSQVKATGTLKTATPDPSTGKAGTAGDVSLGSQTYQNEGRYFWNVSVALPLKAVKSLDYDAATLQPKTIDNKAAYAAFDVYLGKVDTTNARFRLVPALFGGPSFTGKFLDRWMVGASIGAWFVEPFWGYSFLGSNIPVNPKDASDGTYRRWTHAPVWGINIPIRNFYKLASNNSSKATSSTKKTGS
jgi:hypothetical protein